MKYGYILLTFASFFFAQCQQPVKNRTEFIKGLSLVAPHNQYDANPMLEVKNVNSNWIAVIPYAFCKSGEPTVHYDHIQSHSRWWGEGRDGIETTIKLAQEQGLKIMLKPQVWLGKSWIGNLNFAQTQDWEKWETSYVNYILPFAQLAEEKKVEMLCIGTEIKSSSQWRPYFWESLIVKIRQIYHGKLTYAANWDEYKGIRFWKNLDYIGIDAYFPLCDDHNPALDKLINAWDPILNSLDAFSNKFGKPILFTEYGYMSVDGSGGKTWELESNLHALNYNPEAQSMCINALLTSCSKRDFWHGGFIWKWYPDISNPRHDLSKDHTPQGKPAEDILRKWYARL